MSFQRLAHALLHGRPYFGHSLRALQGDPSRHRYFEPTVRRRSELRDGPIRILEIGSWAGASAVTWASALRAVGRVGGVTCIDIWRSYFEAGVDGGVHYRDMTEAAESGDVYRLFLHNLKACGVDSMVTHRIADSRDLSAIFAPGSFDIVYIDGSHLLPLVRSDIAAAIDLVGPAGIICGDDLELQHHEVDATEHAAAVASAMDYAFSPSARQHYHPGVTEGIAEAFGLAANHEGFWAVEQQGTGWVPASLDCTDAALPSHIRDALDERVALIGEVGTFNILRFADRFVAVARTLGPVDVFNERLGDRDLEPVVLVGDSLDEVRAKAASVTPLGAAESQPGPPPG